MEHTATTASMELDNTAQSSTTTTTTRPEAHIKLDAIELEVPQLSAKMAAAKQAVQDLEQKIGQQPQISKQLKIEASTTRYQCAGVVEELTRTLLKLDAIQSNGDSSVRSRRKQIVRSLETMIAQAEQICSQAGDLVTECQTREEQAKTSSDSEAADDATQHQQTLDSEDAVQQTNNDHSATMSGSSMLVHEQGVEGGADEVESLADNHADDQGDAESTTSNSSADVSDVEEESDVDAANKKQQPITSTFIPTPTTPTTIPIPIPTPTTPAAAALPAPAKTVIPVTAQRKNSKNKVAPARSSKQNTSPTKKRQDPAAVASDSDHESQAFGMSDNNSNTSQRLPVVRKPKQQPSPTAPQHGKQIPVHHEPPQHLEVIPTKVMDNGTHFVVLAQLPQNTRTRDISIECRRLTPEGYELTEKQAASYPYPCRCLLRVRTQDGASGHVVLPANVDSRDAQASLKAPGVLQVVVPKLRPFGLWGQPSFGASFPFSSLSGPLFF